MRKHCKLFIIHFVLPIAIGTSIYLIFRPMHLNIFNWVETFGLHSLVLKIRALLVNGYNYLPAWFVYSLPNGLWAYSFMFFISFIWRDAKGLYKVFFIFLVVALSVGYELSQLLSLVPGTFCLTDMFFYTYGLFAGYFLSKFYSIGDVPNERV